MTVSTAIPGYVAGTWRADPANCTIAFAVRQLAISKVRGRFAAGDVTIVTGDNPQHSSVTATIGTGSLDTGNPRRDKHLRSAAYLDAERFPDMTYRSTRLWPTEHGWVVDGTLTLRGVTARVPLSLTLTEFDGRRARFTATARISRREFGAGPSLAGIVADAVSIELEIPAVREN
ncbi:YceI family protein [Labedaea rhizosphaerae]|uniref:Polyisoprenoid-binding protein YceI n=1 Tax=Labedaea rhizosphaerae TaxID=598644 RepID=A0A4R6S6N0_LABRH|nr:YceI family protein [Labedaea rhizosphaerae]TDP94974.1 polyisoprenoid-binding protein YceI [Labedaea rhizosphaerae]